MLRKVIRQTPVMCNPIQHDKFPENTTFVERQFLTEPKYLVLIILILTCCGICSKFGLIVLLEVDYILAHQFDLLVKIQTYE